MAKKLFPNYIPKVGQTVQIRIFRNSKVAREIKVIERSSKLGRWSITTSDGKVFEHRQYWPGSHHSDNNDMFRTNSTSSDEENDFEKRYNSVVILIVKK